VVSDLALIRRLKSRVFLAVWLQYIRNGPQLFKAARSISIFAGNPPMPSSIDSTSFPSSDDLFGSAFNYSSIGMALVGLDGRWLKVNPAVCNILGYSESDLLEIDFQTLTVADDLNADLLHVHQLLDGEITSYEMEKRYIHKNGSIIWALLSVSLVREPSGKPDFFISQIQDISARKQAELQRDAFFKLSNDMLATADKTGYLTQVNPSWTNVLGWSASELTERPFLDFLHPDDVEKSVAETDIASRGEATYGFSNRYRAKDGTYRWIEWSTTANYEGVMYCSARDVTNKKLTEEFLIAEQERIRVTLQSIGDGVITTDVKGVITSINPMGEMITGWTSQEAIGMSIDRVMHLVDETRGGSITNPLMQALDQGAPVKRDIAILIRRDSTDCAITESASPLQRSDGFLLGGVLVFQDVTEKRKAVNQIKYQATHDQLTKLLNRAEFDRIANHLFDDAQENGNEHCVLLLDLDEFKAVNDKGGHMAGDEVLRQIASLISSKLRASDKVARLGGDEFGVLLERCPLPVGERIAEQLIKVVDSHRLDWDDNTFQVGLSIGISTLSKESKTLKDVMAQADAACYRAKAAGRNQFQVAAANDG
jgi:diguanylate cyclase (GGDEF)-like protein/PAS domain S-box-containing protein